MPKEEKEGVYYVKKIKGSTIYHLNPHGEWSSIWMEAKHFKTITEAREFVFEKFKDLEPGMDTESLPWIENATKTRKLPLFGSEYGPNGYKFQTYARA